MTAEEAAEVLRIISASPPHVPPIDARKLAHFYVTILGSLRESVALCGYRTRSV